MEREEPRTAGPKQWGSLGRKGAGRLTAEEFDARNSVGAVGRDTRPAPDRSREVWVRVDDVRDEADAAVRRGRSAEPAKRRARPPRSAGKGPAGDDARRELQAALGSARGDRANERLRDAAHAFERERYEEARKALKPLAEQAPGAVSVRELLGLTYYRLGRWKDAIRELEAFRELTGSPEQHPVLADSYRALGRHREVEALWDELREASPAADLVTEGRIVMAGSLGDRGDLAGAIALLERSQRSVRQPQVHHLRQAYALADLYERAGDVARARELFRWIAGHERDFADAAERAASLG
ncbi:MAG: tetratricopeptide repeat protein [Acidimicrobiales bacterium]|nr:tetratricopeptide repeat protein [Acidimicrobiales bacterium]